MNGIARTRLPIAWILVAALGVAAGDLQAQTPADRDAYLRVVSRHFELPAGEAERLLEDRIAPDELPVLLFLHAESGIAAPALLAMRRPGSTWSQVARRYGVGGDRFHVEIPAAAVDARTRRIHELFTGTPRGGWAALEFTDEETITLVNLRMLAERFTVPPARVLEVRGAVGSWIEVPARLSGGDAW
jgi:hypothetical protein